MQLKRLELAGFKSFAKETEFQFTVPITAVVGPNGSGKSNVVEALRWVLGEQSHKSMRAKRGEDFIFAGSARAPRLSRAQVTLIFDNSAKQFPIDFDELAITRRVSRDGANQYLVNGSQVRLRDVLELLGNVGLGVTQHHIIQQGDADRVLRASLEERRHMIEDALGLTAYHVKRQEAEKRLMETRTNMREANLLRREIQPHLKYLEGQAEKMKRAEELRTEFSASLGRHIAREGASTVSLRATLAERVRPLEDKRHASELRVADITARIAEKESALLTVKASTPVHNTDHMASELRELERELGRTEARIEDLSQGSTAERLVRASDMRTAFDAIRAKLSEALRAPSMEAVRTILEAAALIVADSASRLFESDGDRTARLAELTKKRAALLEQSQLLARDIATFKAKEDGGQDARDAYAELRADEHALREEERVRDAAVRELETIAYERDRVEVRDRELDILRAEYERLFGTLVTEEGAPYESEDERTKAIREIERTRIRYEEMGAVDASVMREYTETVERDEHLKREIEDIGVAITSLESLIAELTEKLEADFTTGVNHINAEFQKFFVEMFGGGDAKLVIEKPKKTKDGDIDEEKAGVGIAVTIPRKRIGSLDMLSGGERSLTSIALLFAMSAVNPPPFLVLDETDAALDEANSRRYASLLTALAKETQLIVVTHNRETMRSAGTLYGVTMSGDGISKTLSIKFEEAVAVAK